MACPEKIKIRSTDIRNALMAGKDISSFTTTTVSELLRNEGLYRETLSGN